MAEPQVFASILSSEEIVVNLAALEFTMTVGELVDLLGLSADEFVDALDRPDNEVYRLLLYESVVETTGGTVWDAVQAREVELPPASGMPPEQVHEWLSYLVARADPSSWVLPEGDLVLPRHPALTRQLSKLEERGGGRLRHFDIVAYEATQPLDKLEERVKALHFTMRKRRSKLAKEAAHAGALARARTLVAFQRHHWRAESRRSDANAGNLEKRDAALAKVEASLSWVEQSLRARSLARDAYKEAELADKLMLMFDPSMPDGADLADLLSLWAEHPNILTGEDRGRLLGLLEQAFKLLAASERVDRFLLNHFLPVFEAVCQVPQARIEDMLASAEAQGLAGAVTHTWADAIEAAKAGLSEEVHSGTNLLPLATVSAVFKTVTGIIASAMNERLIAKFIYYVHMVAGTPEQRAMGRFNLASTLLRFLGTLSVPGKGRAIDKKIWGAIQYGQIVSDVWEAAAGDPEAVARLRALRIDQNFLRSWKGVTANFMCDVAALLLAWDGDSDVTVAKVFNVAASLTSASAGTYLKVAELRLVRSLSMWEFLGPEPNKAVEHVRQLSTHVAGVVSVLGLVAAAADISRKWSAGAGIGDMWLDVGNAVSQVVSVSAWIVELNAGAAGAGALAWLGLSGSVLSGALLVLAIAHDISNTGCEPMFDAHVDFARTIEDDLGLQADFRALVRAINAAKDAGAFSVFPYNPGRREDGASMGRPSWHRLAQFGFSPREVALLFDDGAARIALAVNYGEQPEEPT